MNDRPLGARGDLWRRFLYHHVPLAIASAVLLLAFMSLPRFDTSVYPHADIFSGTFPQPQVGQRTGPMAHGDDHVAPMRHGGERSAPMTHGRDDVEPMGPEQMMDIMGNRRFMRQLSFATGYVALGMLALTLLIGPANLLLGKRNPVSSYLRRDVGTWTAIASVVHVIFGFQVHGSGRIRDFLNYFVAPDGSLWLNSFGLGNWTGLAALVIVTGLLAISSDAVLRKMKARRWKRLQRLNYVLFALVILHAVFYGALLRVTSPFTLLLGFVVLGVFVAQAVGIRLTTRPRGP